MKKSCTRQIKLKLYIRKNKLNFLFDLVYSIFAGRNPPCYLFFFSFALHERGENNKSDIDWRGWESDS